MTLVEIADFDPQRIKIEAAYRFKELIKNIPSASWNASQSCWTVALTWSSCLALRSTFRELDIGPALTAWAIDYNVNRVVPGLALRDALDAPLDGGEDLYSHQRADVLFLSTLRRAMLFNEPGTGKSAAAVRSARRLRQLGETSWPILVVAPNTTKLEWKRQFERWWPGTKVNVVKGSAAQRRKALETPAHAYIINYEALRSHTRLAPYGSTALRKCKACGGEEEISVAKCQKHERELNRIDFQLVIADESHRVKDASSLTSRALKAASGKAPFRFAMTGTPIGHNVVDLWSILNWLEPDEYPSKTRFIERMVDTTYNLFGGMEIVGLKADMEPEWRKATDFRIRRMTKAVVLPFLPPVVTERRDVEMSIVQAKAYKDLCDSALAEMADGTFLSGGTGVIKAIRLLQMASAYGTVELRPRPDGTVSEHLRMEDPSSKVTAFLDDLDDFGTDQVVVFAVSKQLINLLSVKLELLKVRHGLITGDQDEDERQRHMDDFQAGKTQFILCTIGAGGTGITLTAANTRVFLQRSWSLIEMAQAKDRTHRIGSEIHSSITHIDYVTPGTIEEAVLAVLEGKYGTMEELFRDGELFARAITGKITAST